MTGRVGSDTITMTCRTQVTQHPKAQIRCKGVLPLWVFFSLGICSAQLYNTTEQYYTAVYMEGGIVTLLSLQNKRHSVVGFYKV